MRLHLPSSVTAGMLALVLIVPSASSQELGAKVGVSTARFGSGLYLSRLAAGLQLVTPLTSTIALQLEGGYVQKGGDLARTGGRRSRVTLDYAEALALVRVSLVAGPSVSAHLLGGPSVSLELQCNAQAENMATYALAEWDDCDEWGFRSSRLGSNSIDLGAAAGVGIDVHLSPRLIMTLQALADVGLTQHDDVTRYVYYYLEYTSADADVVGRNLAFISQVGFRFVIG